MADVFISYARSDEASARRVAKALEAAGLDVWWDADLPAHRAYSEVIERNLEQAKAVVALWSKAAAGSQWVRAEADFARNAGKLVQGQLDGTMPPMPFNQIQCADLKGWRGGGTHSGWSKLKASAEALVSGEEKAVLRSETHNGIREKLLRFRWPIAALLALVIAASAWVMTQGVPGEERKPVLAVLPFRSLDAQDESLVAGMWEDTRTAIGRNPQLIVLGPNSAQQLADKGEGAVRKAADYMLQASVRTAGDRIRVNANLVQTKSGEQVWSQDFDRKLDDVFALQSEIASEIEGRIRGRLAQKGGTIPEHIATSGDVYALYADARAKIRKRDTRSAIEAHTQLEKVLQMDPNFAPAWAALAVVIGQIPASQKDFKLTESGETYARKSIELAPNLAAGHAALAYALGLEGPVAQAEVERAVELDPSDFEALTWLGNMRSRMGDQKGAIEAYRKVVEMEPFFWPAAYNLYGALSAANDSAGMKQLLADLNRVGADYLAEQLEVDALYKQGNLAQAANLGLQYWTKSTKNRETTPALADLWIVLLQLGFYDEAHNMGPAPDFALPMWKLDPKGIDLLEAHHIPPSAFFSLQPLTENAGRLYLLSGRGKTLANMYLSLKMTPDEFAKLAGGDGPEHFVQSAPLIAIALREDGHSDEANGLLSLAETKAKQLPADDDATRSALLARIYAVQGKKDEALSLLTSAVTRRWMPQAPEILPDLHSDPAFASLKGDPRFEKLRDQIMGTIARERAQVNRQLLAQLKAA